MKRPWGEGKGPMILMLKIRDEQQFSGHVNEELILDNIDRLLELFAKDLKALDPEHHQYTVRREK